MELSGEVMAAKAGQELFCVASVLPLRGYRHIVPLMRISMKVQRQLKTTPGLVRYSMKTDLPKKRFWTFTVWTDRKAMAAFVKEEPHATAVGRFGSWGGEGAGFAEWTSTEGKLDWQEVTERLKKPTFGYRDRR